MPLQITATIEGEHQLSVYLGLVATNVSSFRQPLEKISSEMLKTFDLNFSSRGAVFGGWSPRSKNYPWPLLEKTGQMRSAFTHQVSSDTLTLGNAAPYFKYHQSNQPRARLPRRILMKVDEARRSFMIKSFQRHIQDALRGQK